MASFGASLWRLIKAVTGAVQFWLSLIVTAAAQVALILGYMQLNPYVRFQLLHFVDDILTYV